VFKLRDVSVFVCVLCMRMCLYLGVCACVYVYMYVLHEHICMITFCTCTYEAVFFEVYVCVLGYERMYSLFESLQVISRARACMHVCIHIARARMYVCIRVCIHMVVIDIIYLHVRARAGECERNSGVVAILCNESNDGQKGRQELHCEYFMCVCACIYTCAHVRITDASM
jgi:hypothetical protein